MKRDSYSAGKWDVAVSGPWPVWVTLSYEGRVLQMFRHDHLRDLQYVVERVIGEAKIRLGTDAHEVEA